MPPGVLACPLSPLQQGLLFHSLYTPGSGCYAVQMRMRLRGVNRPAFEAAGQGGVDRDQVLRTPFHCPAEGEPEQRIQPAVRVMWEKEDWRDLGDAERDACRQQWL